MEVNLDMRDGGGLAEHIVLGEGCICLRALHLPSGAFPSFGALMAAAMDAHR